MKSLNLVFFAASLISSAAVQAQALVPSDIFRAIERNDKKAVKAWIKSKPDFSIKNTQGQSVLTVAVRSKNYSIVKQFLNAGVAVNAQDNFGKTALDYAVELYQNTMAFKLVKNKAKLTTMANQEHLKQMYAQRYKRLCWIFGGLMIGGVIVSILGFGLVVCCASSCFGFCVGFISLIGVVGAMEGTGALGLIGTGAAATASQYKKSDYLLNNENSVSEK